MSQNVILTPEEFRALTEQMSTLTKQVQQLQQAAGATSLDDNGVLKTVPVKLHEIRVAFVDNNPVVALRNQSGSDDQPLYLVEKPDPLDPRKYHLHADLIVYDLATGKHRIVPNVRYIEFIQNTAKKSLPVVDVKNDNWYIDEGKVKRKEVKKEGWGMEETEDEVQAFITGVTRTFCVEVNGSRIWIPENFANMA